MNTHPVLHGATVLLTVAIPRDTFATLQGIASADATCSVDWLDFDQDGAAVEGVRRG